MKIRLLLEEVTAAQLHQQKKLRAQKISKAIEKIIAEAVHRSAKGQHTLNVKLASEHTTFVIGQSAHEIDTIRAALHLNAGRSLEMVHQPSFHVKIDPVKNLNLRSFKDGLSDLMHKEFNSPRFYPKLFSVKDKMNLHGLHTNPQKLRKIGDDTMVVNFFIGEAL